MLLLLILLLLLLFIPTSSNISIQSNPFLIQSYAIRLVIRLPTLERSYVKQYYHTVASKRASTLRASNDIPVGATLSKLGCIYRWHTWSTRRRDHSSPIADLTARQRDVKRGVFHADQSSTRKVCEASGIHRSYQSWWWAHANLVGKWRTLFGEYYLR